MDSMALIDTVLAVQQAALREQVETTIMRKTLDVMKSQGQAAVEMIEQAAELAEVPLASTPGLGSSIDQLI